MEEMMKNKIKPIVALLVDDDKEYSENIKKIAKTKGIIFKTVYNLPEMKVELPKIHKIISTIVLDIRGLTEENQKDGKPDFVIAAYEVILTNQSFRDIPVCLITADSNNLSTFKGLYSKLNMYLKTREQENKLFEQIKENSKNLKSIKLRRKYNDIFNPLQTEYRNQKLQKKIVDIDQELMTLFQKFQEGDFSIIRDNLARIRRIQELTFQSLRIIDKRLLPSAPFDTNGNIIFNELDNHHKKHKLDDKEICSGVINLMRAPIYVLSSKDGAHVPFEDSSYPPTKYTVQALTFALLDFLKWFGILLTKYNKES
jgi:hypothetical protein